MKKIGASLLLVVLVASLLLAGCAPTPAPTPTPEPTPEPTPGEEAASFYEGKNITFIVPYKPGGGYDTYARLIAPYLEKETGATVLVRNMPGGETYIALNHVYQAKPDGLTILIIDTKTAILSQLTSDPKAAGTDIRNFRWLCRIVTEPTAIALSTKSPYRTVDDLKAATEVIKLGGTARGDRNHITASVLIEVLGLNGEVILGFEGSSEVALAAMRGELDGFASGASSILEYTKQPELFPLLYVSSERSPLMPDLPTILEFDISPEQKKWVDRVDTIIGAGRAVAATPGTPENRVQFLRDALDKALHSEGLLAMSEQIDRPIAYLSGDDIESSVNELLGMSEEEIKAINDVMLEKYTR